MKGDGRADTQETDKSTEEEVEARNVEIVPSAQRA